MNNQKQLKKYANSFIDSIKPNIKSGYQLAVNIHPANASGATIEFEIIEDRKSKITVVPAVASVNKTLGSIEQRMIGGNLDGVRFSGTNVYMEGNRIVIVKGEDDHSSWNKRAAEKDVKRVISPKGDK